MAYKKLNMYTKFLRWAVFSLLITGSAFGQSLPTVPGYTNLSQKNQWMGVKPPPDTIWSKYGLALRPEGLYIGNGTSWTLVGSGGTITIPGNYGNILVNRNGVLSTPAGDSLMYDATGITAKFYSGTGARQLLVSPLGLIQASQIPIPNGVTDGCQVIRGPTGLQVVVTTPCSYNINNLQYSLSAPVTVTLATADGSNPRRDNVYVNTSSTAAAETGTPAANPEVPTIDPATQLSLTDVLVPTSATVPSIGQTIIRDEGSGGEWTISKTVTSTDNYGTNPYNGTISQRITAATANQYMRWTAASTQSAANKTLVLYIRNNATFNAARAMTAQKMLSGVTSGLGVALTTWGYSKTVTGYYQIVAIPMSTFQGSDAFDAINIVFTGTGGTVDVQIDYVQLQSGVVQPGGNGLASLFRRSGTDSVYGVTAGGATVFQYRDSIGSGSATTRQMIGTWDSLIVSGSSLVGFTSSAGTSTITIGSGGAAVSGGNGNQNDNYVRSDKVGSSNNYSIIADVVITTKPTTGGVQGLSIKRFSTTASISLNLVATIRASHTDSIYIAGTTINGTGNGTYVDSSIRKIFIANGDTVRIYLNHTFAGYSAKMVKRSNGQDGPLASTFNYKYPPYTSYVGPNTGKIGFTGLGGAYKVIGLKEVDYDFRNPELLIVGTSISGIFFTQPENTIWQRVFDGSPYRHVNFAQPGSALSDWLESLPHYYAVQPQGVVIEGFANDNAANIRANLTNLIDSFQAHSIPVRAVINDQYNLGKDSIIRNVCFEQGVRFIDFGSTIKADMLNEDGLHLNDRGTSRAANLIQGEIGEYVGSNKGASLPNLKTSLEDVDITTGDQTHGMFLMYDTAGVDKYRLNNGSTRFNILQPSTGTWVAQVGNTRIQGYSRWEPGYGLGVGGDPLANVPIATYENVTQGSGLQVWNANATATSSANYAQVAAVGSAGFGVSIPHTAYFGSYMTNGVVLSAVNNGITFIAGSSFQKRMFLSASTGYMKIGGSTAATSMLEVVGSFASTYTATATSLSADATHSVIDVTATGQTITLPTAAGITGREYTIKLTASGSGTVATTSSQTIDGSTTYSLASQYKYVTVKSTGANWIIIANN